MDFGITGITSITVICFLAGQVWKAAKIKKTWIPPMCGSLGAVLGILAMYIMPSFPAHDLITAMAIGAVSGFSATGIHQIYKQTTKTD